MEGQLIGRHDMPETSLTCGSQPPPPPPPPIPPQSCPTANLNWDVFQVLPEAPGDSSRARLNVSLRWNDGPTEAVINFDEPSSDRNYRKGNPPISWDYTLRDNSYERNIVAKIDLGSAGVCTISRKATIPAKKVEPPARIEWHHLAVCDVQPDEVEIRGHNLNTFEIKITGQLFAKPDNGAVKMISEVPGPYQTVPGDGWGGPEERIRNHYQSFRGVVYGWAEARKSNGELIGRHEMPQIRLSCGY
jgi:hypothetical protein